MQIRKISLYDRTIKDKYYATSTGVIYTSVKSRKVMKDGVQHTITKHLLDLAHSSENDWIVPFQDFGLYCIVLKDGTILRRLKTYIRPECCSVTVPLVDVFDKEIRRYVSRLVANTFISAVDGKEVHHIDRNRSNNNLNNLEVLDFDTHRGVGSVLHK